ncbi:MAG: ATP-binding cassette domain-containing protein [Ruminococcus sp.]|nr:ATP-binding cassette domain-containing protein [Ruminococcus sp.]
MSTAITVNDVHLRYRNDDKHRLFHRRKKREEVLKGISFEVEAGEVVGIIGPNGSGKSTVMKVIAGLMSPDKGSVELYGNSVSLLALGIGFHNELSGRDNIYLSGILMGYSKKEIEKRYKDIANFSELGEYLDKPVRTYSSGMRSKLTFSTAVNLKADIMLIDEVFSVGDMRFRKKSRAVMEEMIQEDDMTVLMVSHNLEEIRKMCRRVIWIEDGQIKDSGDTETVLKAYYKSMADNVSNINYLEAPTVEIIPEDGKVHLSWTHVENATDYRIYRKDDLAGSRWAQIADGYEETEFFDVPPSTDISYRYTVRARTNNGRHDIWSEFIPSDLVRMYEDGTVKKETERLVAPAIPEVEITVDAEGIRLDWDKAENAVDYRIYRKDVFPGSSWHQIADRCTDNFYTDVPPSDTDEYMYTVRARASSGIREAWSEYIPAGPVSMEMTSADNEEGDEEMDVNSFMPLSVPEVTAEVRGDSVHLSWDEIERADDYRVFRRERKKGSRWQIIADDYKETSFDDDISETGDIFYYTVRAKADTEKGRVWSEFEIAVPVVSDETAPATEDIPEVQESPAEEITADNSDINEEQKSVPVKSAPAEEKAPEEKETSAPAEAIEASKSGQGVHISWTAAEDAMNYRLYRKENGAKRWDMLIDNYDKTEYDDNSPEEGREYIYAFRVRRSNGRHDVWSSFISSSPVKI